MPVGVADRDVVAAIVVPLEDRDDLLRREPVDRGDDRRVDQAAVRERQEVEVVVDQVELRRTLEHRRDVQPLPHLRVQLRSSEYPVGIVPTSVADVSESAAANSVTSTPRATNPSVRSETNCSHGP